MISRQPTIQKASYRPEIDGLRAIAILTVIANHFNKNLLPGGYLGVDIFFVISGYVITSSLSNKTENNFREFITSFYTRRVKRLVPAMIIFTLLTSILICLFNPSPEVHLKTGIASLFGFSNIYLFKQATDYFGLTTELNPFTHTWSLAVEEQFYLIFPIITWLTGFSRKKESGYKILCLLLILLSSISLLGFISQYTVSNSAAYFLMPWRFWEIASGSILFLLERRYSLRIASSWFELSSYLIPLILLVMLAPLSLTYFGNIIIVLLTLIVISNISGKSTSYRILTIQPLRYIGIISYSLYLWHWVILSISKWTIGIHWWSVPLQILLTVTLGIVSYNLIEKPFRTNLDNDSNSQVLFKGLSTILISAFAINFVVKSMSEDLYVGSTFADEKTNKNCITKDSLTYCNFTSINKNKTIWIVGDSHAGSFINSSDQIAKELSRKVKIYSLPSTTFPAIDKYRKSHKTLDLKNNKLFKDLVQKLPSKLNQGDILIISIRFPFYFGGTYYGYNPQDVIYLDDNGETISQQSAFINWLNNLNAIAKELRTSKSSIIIMTPLPEWELAKTNNCTDQRKEWFNKLGGYECELPRDFFTGNNGIYNNIINKLTQVSIENNNIFLFNSFQVLCPGKTCKSGESGRAYTIDGDHLTNFAVNEKITPQILQFIKEKIIN